MIITSYILWYSLLPSRLYTFMSRNNLDALMNMTVQTQFYLLWVKLIYTLINFIYYYVTLVCVDIHLVSHTYTSSKNWSINLNPDMIVLLEECDRTTRVSIL
jgi:hypothetical protein